MPTKFRSRRPDHVRGKHTGRDDIALVKAAQKGDRQALDQLLRRHYDRIYTLCRRLTGNDTDALDATQEALIAIARGLPKFARKAKFTTWYYRVVTNAALDEVRRRSRRPYVGLSEAQQHLEPVGAANTPGDPAGAVTNRVDLDKALGLLPEPFHTTVILRDVMELEYAEIAEVLQIPPGTVRSRIARGRRQLATILQTNDGNSEPSEQRQKNST